MPQVLAIRACIHLPPLVFMRIGAKPHAGYCNVPPLVPGRDTPQLTLCSPPWLVHPFPPFCSTICECCWTTAECQIQMVHPLHSVLLCVETNPGTLPMPLLRAGIRGRQDGFVFNIELSSWAYTGTVGCTQWRYHACVFISTASPT